MLDAMASSNKRKHVDEQISEDPKKKHILGDIYYITIRTENKNHYAKRNVLVQRSTYFHTMFTSGFFESDKDVIDLSSITSQNLKHIIEFTHDSDKISLTEDNALTLLQDADYLGIDDLKQKCYQFMCDNVTANNAFHAYQTADLLDYTQLKKEAKALIGRAFLLVAQRDKHFLDCKVEFLKELLSAREVQVCPAVAVFNVVMKWFAYDMEYRKVHLESVLAKIKIDEIDRVYLKNYFDGENMGDEDIVKTIMPLRQKNVKSKSQNDPSSSDTRIIVLPKSSLNVVEMYSSRTGKWKVIETGEKEYRSSYTCAIHDGKLYVFGGKIAGKCTNTAKVYDFTTKCWSSLPPMSTARQRAASAVLDDYIYVFAGRKDDNTDLNSAERYCPTTNEWELIAPLNEPRCDHNAVAFEGHLYVNGGVYYSSKSVDRLCNWNAQIEKYDPQTNTWTNVEIIKPRRRSNFGITVLNGSIYSCGGINHGDILDCSDYYNPNNKDQWWKYTHNLHFCMNQPRANHALVTCEGKLWAIGGSDGTVEICDPTTNFWTYGPPMNKISGAVVAAVFTV